MRRELCAEAIRLARLLAEMLPDEPEVAGLLALMLLHDARRDGAHRSRRGEIVLLADQDRSLWDRDADRRGPGARPPRARAPGARALHAPGRDRRRARARAAAAETDWARIARLYDWLRADRPLAGRRAQPRRRRREARGPRRASR